MKAIKRNRNVYILLLLANVIAAILFAAKEIPEVAVVFGTVTIILLNLLIRQNRRIYEVQLILDNPILTENSTVVSISGDKKQQEVGKAIISTFGALIGSKIYSWGHHGVRLVSVEIDKRKIHLRFGSDAETMHIELLHNLTDIQTVTEVQQKLWQETSIIAQISGW